MGSELHLSSPGKHVAAESRAALAGLAVLLPLPQLCSQLAEPREKWVTRGARREPLPTA